MTGLASGAPAKSGITKPGSSFMEKQIAFAVKEGKQVCVTQPAGDVITGWVMGMDAYHWGVVDSIGRVHLVHKSNTLTITPTLLDQAPEYARTMVEPVVAPFRDTVMRDYFKQASPAN